MWYITNRVEGTRFFDHFWMGRQFTGAAVYYISTWSHMRDYCKQLYPEGSPYEKSTALFYDHCALAYSNHRGNHEIGGPNSALFDYSDIEFSKDTRTMIDNICDLILVAGVLLYLLGYNFNQRAVLMFCFIMNILLGLYKLVELDLRYGIDYIAYLQ